MTCSLSGGLVGCLFHDAFLVSRLYSIVSTEWWGSSLAQGKRKPDDDSCDDNNNNIKSILTGREHNSHRTHALYAYATVVQVKESCSRCARSRSLTLR